MCVCVYILFFVLLCFSPKLKFIEFFFSQPTWYLDMRVAHLSSWQKGGERFMLFLDPGYHADFAAEVYG